ncbi:MAG: matrixin family metalloprotease, partial [bacterium]|nr:matrixin family metalloprotease [bacterium]
GGTSTQTSVTYNGTNLVYFDTTPPDGGGYIAATFIWAGGGNISECDLVFNDQSYTWWNGSGFCGNKYDIWDIATHEFGHFLCLADLYGGGDSQKTMYGYGSSCQTYARTLHSDDINGIIAIYGAGVSCTDPTANAGQNKALCDGNTVVLDGSASGGSGGSCPGDYSPSWSGPGIVSGGNTFNPTVDATGTYTLTVSCDTCQDGDSMVVSAAAPGDWNGDGSIALDDFAEFEQCLDDPDGGLAAPGCACGDFDGDDDVDLDDFSVFQVDYTG